MCVSKNVVATVGTAAGYTPYMLLWGSGKVSNKLQWQHAASAIHYGQRVVVCEKSRVDWY
jgi:hypothetical protein